MPESRKPNVKTAATNKRTTPRKPKASTRATASNDPVDISTVVGVTVPGGQRIPNVGGLVSGPVDGFPPSELFAPSSRTSLFDRTRPGKAIVRPSDLVALRIELVNMKVVPGVPPTLTRAATGPAFIVLHFPPQAIAEQVFFESAPAGATAPDLPPGVIDKPDGVPGVSPPPIRARASGESRVVFKVPENFSIPYALANVLDACQRLGLNVPANALPPGGGRPIIIFQPSILDIATATRLNTQGRVAIAGNALRSVALAATQGANSTTLAARVTLGGVGSLRVTPNTFPQIPRFNPTPTAPGTQQTAIEMPWRLLLSPHANERFHHAPLPVTSALTKRTELWHSRMLAPNDKGELIEPPKFEPNRTTRAVWALTGEGSNRAMSSTFPTSAELPVVSDIPFLATLDDYDRFQIAHLSSNFDVAGYTPNALDTNLLMLSSLGGWLDLRGAWDPPGLSVEEWAHRASMGRDHYVRVVYKGFLYPFGHRVSLVKVSERKFHNGKNGTSAEPGNPAYLRQRMFIVVRQRDKAFVDPQLVGTDGRSFQRQFPFNNVRILTAVTPNLDDPNNIATNAVSRVGAFGQKMFWPCVNNAPFKFRCIGTDYDGNRVQFELPMIFMDNSIAAPRNRVGKKLLADFPLAETHALTAAADWMSRNDGSTPRRTAEFSRQRVTLAPTNKSGDTSAEIERIEFGGEQQFNHSGLRAYSDNLSRPVFYPSMIRADVRIAALSQLTGAGANNALVWSLAYLRDGFDAPDVAPASAKNKGQIFAEIAGQAKLDFSTQGDRSGGFVMPNLKPSGLSRLSGPVSGPLDKLMSGAPVAGTDMFPSSLSDLPLPLLFGCIPLGEILKAMTGGGDKLPNFTSEASSKLEAFFNVLTRAYTFVEQLGNQSGSLAQAAIDVVKSTIKDHVQQAVAVPAAQVAQIESALQTLDSTLDALRSRFDSFVAAQADGSLPSISQIASALSPANASNLTANVDSVIASVENLKSKTLAATLPSGFKQSLLSAAAQALLFLNDVKTVIALVSAGGALFDALKDVVENPAIFSEPATLGAKLDIVKTAVDNLRNTVSDFRLLDGAPKKTLVDALNGVSEVLGLASDLAQILQNLLGDELVIRFDWKPEIDNWALPGESKDTDPIFRANDKHGFVVAVEAKVKKSGGSPKIGVVCSLKHFDLVLIAPAAFMELNFEKIEFSVDQSAKMNVDVLLTDIKFVGPLSFVETLKDLIPLDGFSDPPYLDITPSGIDAGFSLALPNITVGIFSLTNLSLGAGFTVPFIGQPLSVRFNFCTREQPFNLTVTLFGGGGFFGVTIDPHGVQILEAALEFGASLSIDFGVASGGVHVMAGVYFRMEKDAASLTGYFRLGGHVSVLCIITASIELYLELRYEFSTGKCVGKATLTIEVSVFMFSVSVEITCERKFAGSNGDPTFREIMGLNPALTLADELTQIQDVTQYAWRDYCEAYA